MWIAQGTFRIEPEHGRSRVFAQWVDTEDDTQVRRCFRALVLQCAMTLEEAQGVCTGRNSLVPLVKR